MDELVPTAVAVCEEPSGMRRWLVKVRSKRGLALRDVFIVARDEHSARHRVQQMYLLSEIGTICLSAPESRATAASISKR
ncbi:MAG: hypothetical protein ABSF50_02105 [Burkholderiaceae bacterium]